MSTPCYLLEQTDEVARSLRRYLALELYASHHTVEPRVDVHLTADTRQFEETMARLQRRAERTSRRIRSPGGPA